MTPKNGRAEINLPLLANILCKLCRNKIVRDIKPQGNYFETSYTYSNISGRTK